MKAVMALACGSLLCLGAAAQGEWYEYTYYPPESPFIEGEELPGPFPEDQGWERNYGAGTVYREITPDAELLLESWEMNDWEDYRRGLDPQSDLPAEAEYLYAEWRVAVDEQVGYDTNVHIALGEALGDITISMNTDHVRDAEGGEWYDYPDHEPGDAHTLLFRTVNSIDYDLFVDGKYAFSDAFKLPSLVDAKAVWGDTSTAYSTSRWAFFRFGVTPLGDIDINGQVDLVDFATFAICYTNGGTYAPPGCSDQEFALSDLDNDGDTDLVDFATFAVNYTN